MNETYKLFKQLEPFSASSEMEYYHQAVKKQLVAQLERDYDIFSYPSFVTSYSKETLLNMHADEIVGLLPLYKTIQSLLELLTQTRQSRMTFDIPRVQKLSSNGLYDFTNLAIVKQLYSLVKETSAYNSDIFDNIEDPWNLINPTINQWYTVKELFRTDDLSVPPTKSELYSRLRGKPLHYFSYQQLLDDNTYYVAKHKLKVSRRYHIGQFSLYGGSMLLFGLVLSLLRVFYEPIVHYLFDQTFLYLVWVFVVGVLLTGVGWLAILLQHKPYPFPYYRSMAYLMIIVVYIELVVTLTLYQFAWPMIVATFFFLLAGGSRFLRDYMLADNNRPFHGYFEYGYSALLIVLSTGLSLFGSFVLVSWYSLFILLLLAFYFLVTFLALGELKDRW